MRGTKSGAFFSIWLVRVVGKKGECRFQKWRVFRERKYNFSLDLQAFGPSDLIEPRIKVVLRGKGYAWELVLWSFNNSKR